MRQRTDKEMEWELLDSETVVKRPWLNVTKDRVRLPNGRVHDEYYVLHYPDWVNVIALTTDGMMILERQYRHGIRRVGTEIVAGCVEPGESPFDAAQRELLEETGYAGGRWTPFLKLCPNPGAMDNTCYCFLAEDVEPIGTRHLDATEDIEVMLKRPEEVWKMLDEGCFLQAMMVAPLLKFFMKRAKKMKTVLSESVKQ